MLLGRDNRVQAGATSRPFHRKPVTEGCCIPMSLRHAMRNLLPIGARPCQRVIAVDAQI
jgi:hypothetical protein